jgi:hypothetical protein
MIATLEKGRRKDKAKIWDLSEVIHEQFHLQNLSFLDQKKKKMLKKFKENLE